MKSVNRKSQIVIFIISWVFLSASFFNDGSGILDLNFFFNYANQFLPERAENRWNDINPITNEGATLGRVLFYDKQLSVNNTTSCASCHQQENAFGDHRRLSAGFEGKLTARHAMRLVNVDNDADNKRFWDERAVRLEGMTTAPIKDPIELGFSGANGYPGIDSLLLRMDDLEYYPILFEKVFGDKEITEERIAFALAQFIRSILSFDTRFDEGFALVGEEITNFPNFTDEENRGKRLFFNFPTSAPDHPRRGAGCGFCHKAPSMDIIHLSQNNGVIGVAGDSTMIDVTVVRSPAIKNLVRMDGSSLGPFMHDGSLETLEDVVNHYNDIPFDSTNTNLSGLLFPRSNGHVKLNMSDDEKAELVAFLKTLSGEGIFTNPKWSDPFDENGQLIVIESATCIVETDISISICDGDSFQGYSTTGIHRDTFSVASGCDSIVIIDLLVIPLPENIENVEICDGQSFQGHSISGEYRDTITSTTGCDSVDVLHLTVLPPVTFVLEAWICEGEDFLGFTEEGAYEFVRGDSLGCDTTFFLDLAVANVVMVTDSAQICEGQEYRGFSESGSHILTFQGGNGCDSIVTIELEVFPVSSEICLMTNIDEELEGGSLNIWPNPANNFLNIQLEVGNVYNFKLYDVNGVELDNKKTSLKDLYVWDVSKYNAGLYFIEVSSKFDEQKRLIKMVKY